MGAHSGILLCRLRSTLHCVWIEVEGWVWEKGRRQGQDVKEVKKKEKKLRKWG